MSDAYRVKKILHYERECRILLQAENGPCPLLAIMNILLLNGKLSLSAQAISTGFAAVEDVVNSLATMLLETTAQSEAMVANHEQNVMDAVDSLSSLKEGLDVNIRFTGCAEKEYTRELIVFDLLGIEMLHGWLVDPQDVDTATAIGKKTYNQLMERLIESVTAETPRRTPSQEAATAAEEASAAAGEAPAAEDEAAAGEAPAAEEAAAKEASATEAAPATVAGDAEADDDAEFAEMTRTHSELKRDGMLVETFLNQHVTQLTYFGLSELHRVIAEGQSVCFFRNNHYSVLHKYKGQLYNLVTDEGYFREGDIVWEHLDEVEGDSDFYNGRFQRFVPHSQRPPAPSAGAPIVQGVPVTGVPIDT